MRTFPQGKDGLTSHCDLCPPDPEEGAAAEAGVAHSVPPSSRTCGDAEVGLVG